MLLIKLGQKFLSNEQMIQNFKGDGDVFSLIEQLFSNMDVAALLHCQQYMLRKRHKNTISTRQHNLPPCLLAATFWSPSALGRALLADNWPSHWSIL